MRLTVLGTSAGMPTKERNVPALALQFDQLASWWLFDCGEGTQRQILATQYSPARLERIFITHLHGDHCLGVFGLLASRSLNKITAPVTIHAPRGMGEMLESVWKHTGTHLQFEVTTLDPPIAPVEYPEATVTAVPVSHNIAAFAYIVKEPDYPGRFLIEKALADGIPPGSVYARLKAGETVTLPDGRVVDGAAYTEPPKRGRKLIIVGDNRTPDLLLPYLADADLLVHEATFSERMLVARNDENGERYAHSTARQVALTAQKAGVPNLILTHLSAGFSRGKNKPFPPEQLLDEAREVYRGNCLLARDFLTVDLNREGAMKTV